MSQQPSYQFYATLLDTFQSYLSSDSIWERYWGNSTKDGVLTQEEFAEQCRQGVIDRINRVPFSSKAADQGTCFNEVVDCLILNRNTDREDMTITSDKATNNVYATIRREVDGVQTEEVFEFPMSVCREFADYYKGATPQVYCEGHVPTKYGLVKIYGYIDELMMSSVHDLKTTKMYTAGSFRKHWQHHVYPYCLQQMGAPVEYFEYNVCEIKRGTYDKFTTFTEFYKYDHEVSRAMLIDHCEQFIEFINNHKDQITDKKIFNQLKEEE